MKPTEEADPFQYVDIIYGWDLPLTREEFIFDGYHKIESQQYLEAVDEVQRLTDSEAIYGGKSVLEMALARLANEFRNILTLITTNSTQHNASYALGSNTVVSSMTDTSSSWGFHEEDYMNSDTLNIELISDLQSITKRMKSAGYLRRCVQLYTSARKNFLNSRFRGIWGEELSLRDMLYIDLDQMEKKTKEWIQASKACFQILFIYEKQLCEQIFGKSTTADECFMETVKDVATKIFHFAEEASKSRDSVRRLFVILDIYNAFSDAIQHVNIVFNSEQSESIRIRAARILSRLQEAVTRILWKFEEDVIHDQSPIPPVGDSKIHYFPVYVMNYIQRLSEYQKPLMEVITSMALPSSPQTPPVEEILGKTPLSVHLIWITTTLILKLERKAKLYEDALSGHLFLMNHLYYIVNEIVFMRQLRELIGDHYLKTLIDEFQRNQVEYLGLALQKILYSLRNKGLQVMGCFPCGVSKRTLKQRLVSFNATFKEIHQILAKSAVTDRIVQHNLQESMLEELIPAYTSFLQQFRSHIKTIEYQKYIKYSSNDLKNAVHEFLPVCIIRH